LKTKVNFSSTNEHKISLSDRSTFKVGSISRQTRSHDGKPYFEAIGLVTDRNVVGVQALFYPDSDWTSKEAAHHASSKYGAFVKMEPSKNAQEEDEEEDEEEDARHRDDEEEEEDSEAQDEEEEEEESDEHDPEEDEERDRDSQDEDEDDEEESTSDKDRKGKAKSFDLVGAIMTGAENRRKEKRKNRRNRR